MSIFSLLPDILPMIMPSAVSVIKATDLEAQRQEQSKDSRMIRQGAVIGKSDRMCATETIIYASSGKGILVTNPSGEEQLKRLELSAGDFAFIPPWTEHQEINETDEDVVWILIRSGPEPVVVWLTGWDGDRAKAD
ncbi:cupin domain-containing protein [Xylariaceae sp. AK1471]|nr:cupin domain-containing protein [Xylariaceae sp. AK1471]